MDKARTKKRVWYSELVLSLRATGVINSDRLNQSRLVVRVHKREPFKFSLVDRVNKVRFGWC
eukprot:m.443140 g.443140  ORF g.443140 m.443140 type:complete len:62 (+) comp18925_c0_seq1:105-290(+)